MRMMKLLYFFVLLMICRSSIITNTYDNTTFLIHTPRYRHAMKNITSFTTVIVPGGLTQKDIQSCKALNPGFSLQGLAVMVALEGGCSPEHHANLAIQQNASAVFLIGYYVDSTAYFKDDNTKVMNLKVPVLMISDQDVTKISRELTKNGIAAKNGTFYPLLVTIIDDRNEFDRMTNNGGFIFLQVILELTLLFGLAVGIRGQVMYLKEEGPKASAAQICLLFNNLGIITNMIFILDFIGKQEWYSWQLIICSLFLTQCFVVIASTSLAYFFMEVLREKKLMFPGLSKFKYPFILTSVAIFSLYIGLMVIFSRFNSTIPLTRAGTLFPMSIYFILMILFIYGGGKVLHNLHTFKSPIIPRLTAMIAVSVFGMIIIICALSMYASLRQGIRFYVVSFVFNVSGHVIICIPQVLTFWNPPKRKNKTNNNSNDSSKKKSDKEEGKDFEKKSINLSDIN